MLLNSLSHLRQYLLEAHKIAYICKIMQSVIIIILQIKFHGLQKYRNVAIKQTFYYALLTSLILAIETQVSDTVLPR